MDRLTGMFIVVCYDSPDDRRRNRMAKALAGFGERVQDSVFECWLDASQLRQLQAALSQLADPLEDRIRYYNLCGKDIGNIRADGLGSLPRDTLAWII
ncbi:MAG: CRISPR-associated endonuclease Cas2 [Thiohalomonadaceae bacterium]